MSHHLYQLKTTAAVGQHVVFAGVWDKYGIVLRHQDSGYHLIRGLGTKPPAGIRSFIQAEVEH
jgi:hypothetical protein